MLLFLTGMERYLIVDHQKFTYEGLFNYAELFAVIGGWFFDKNYDWYEKMNQEDLSSTGRQIRVVLEPWKNISDYYKLRIKIRLNVHDLKEVEVESEGQNLRLNQGLIKMTVDGYVISDRKNKWNEKPFYWFLSIILDKYFFRNHFAKAENWLKNDVQDLYTHIRTHLNVFKKYQS